VRLRDLIHPSRVLLAVLGIAMLAAGCRSHRADDAKSGPEVIYARAQKAMKNSKPCNRAFRSANPRANLSWI